MIADVTFFNTEEDLLELTGLTDRKELWDNGFDLDDWDNGFVCDAPLMSPYENYKLWRRPDMHLIEDVYNGYCVGPSGTEYDGKYYHIAHHA